MSVDDIKYLEFGETVFIRNENRTGKVRGIDLWSLRVRVEFDEYNCNWIVPRLIERINSDVVVSEHIISTEEILNHSTVKTYKDKVEKLKKISPPNSIVNKKKN